MLSGHRSAWRRRGRNSRAARIAVPLAIPMALGLTLGIILAVSGGPVTTINQSATGVRLAVREPGGVRQPRGGRERARPRPARRPARAPARRPPRWSPPAPSFANGQTAFRQLGDVATNPVDGTGAAINLNQTAAQAAASMNCTHHRARQPAERARSSPRRGNSATAARMRTPPTRAPSSRRPSCPRWPLQVYNPLVITAGTTPAATPVAPTIARGPSVIIDVGFNGTNLVLAGPRRPAGQLRRRPGPVGHRPGLGLQRGQLLPLANAGHRERRAHGPRARYRLGRPAVPRPA